MTLREQWFSLAQRYSPDATLVSQLWGEIAKNYSDKKRHYHTLEHLENLFAELEIVRAHIGEWDVLSFSVFYHDVIYNVKKHDNEEQSALFAAERLRKLNVPEAMIVQCAAQINATKSHTVSDDPDTNLFTDADLSVLGKPWALYENYFRQVRKEYSIYPDLLYKPGRKKVLRHFLEMKRIFKTDLFFAKYEQQARENLERELELL